MDDLTLQSLLRALEATPENSDLRRVLVRSYMERGDKERAFELLSVLEADALTEPDRLQLVDLALATGRIQRALELADGSTPEMQMRRARILLGLDRRDEAREAYRTAVDANPALEDRDLKSRLEANVRSFPGAADSGRPALKVISNDDTDEGEVRRLLIPEVEKVTFKDVGGLEDIKKLIHKKIILPFQKPSLFQRFKRRAGGGILLYGPPGCGKTMLARATAGECGATFLNVAISDILDMWYGESEKKLHALFEQARQKTPAVLFFDELEGLGGRREYSRDGGSSRLASTFLTEMDGFAEGNSGVLILAATNVPWSIDAAFRRPGRFDRVLFVPPPDRPARAAILSILLEGRPTTSGLDFDTLAAASSGFSGADLRHLVETASDEAIEESLERESEVPISQAHLKAALKGLKPTTVEWLTTARNYARYANEGGQYDEVLEFLKTHGKG